MRALLAAAIIAAGSAWAQGAAPAGAASPEGSATAAAAAPEAAAAPSPAPASTEGCARWAAPGLPEGPIALGFFDADVATGRRVCPRTEVGIGGRLGLTVDTPNFYGTISGDAEVFGSVALAERTELFGTLEALHHQWVQNATLKGSGTSLGQLTLGGSHITYRSGELASATSARLMLPTSGANPNVYVLGAEVGQALSFRPSDAVEVHGYAGVDFSAAASPASSDPRLGVLINAGAQWSPLSRFGLVLDVNGHYGGLQSYLAPAIGLRFRPYRDLGAELGVTLPVAGSDRHDLLAGLRLGYRL